MFSFQDMNEPANFGTNLDKPWNWPEDDKPYWSLKCPAEENPPFIPGKQAQLVSYSLQNPKR